MKGITLLPKCFIKKSLQSKTSFWDSEKIFNIIRMIIQEIEIGPNMINVDQYGICFLHRLVLIVSIGCFSSPELEAQESFSDYNLFVIRLFICLSICISVSLTVYKLFTFLTSSELVNKFQLKFGTKHKWVKGIKVCLNELSSPLSRRDNKKLVNLVAKNQLARKG